MAKEGGNWFSRHKVLTVILAIIVLAAVASAGGGKDSKNSGSSGSGSSQSQGEKKYRFADRADKQEKDVELALNESGTLDGMKLTTTSAEYKTALGEYDQADSGKTYIVVAVQLENSGDRTKPYNPYDFRVQTAGGQVLDPTIAMIETLNSGDLVTGGKVSGNIVFEVPVEEGSQYLIWKPGVSSDRAIVKLK